MRRAEGFFLFMLLPWVLLAEPTMVVPVDGLVHREALAIVRPEALAPFFQALKALEARAPGAAPKHVGILHLGDSHLQSDQLSRPLRQALQRRFGSAGRGLFFPYKVARSTDALDLNCESNVRWTTWRNVPTSSELAAENETGLSGFTITTEDPAFILHLGLRMKADAFDTLTIFPAGPLNRGSFVVSQHPNPDILKQSQLLTSDHFHQIQSGDTLYGLAKAYGTTAKQLRHWNKTQGDRLYLGERLIVGKDVEPRTGGAVEGFQDLSRVSGAPLSVTVRLAQSGNDLFLRGSGGPGAEAQVALDGFVASLSTASGVFYHAAGVNGAQLWQAAKAGRFAAQARCLDVDLLILAFGTNESMDPDYDRKALEKGLDKLIAGLSQGRSRPLPILVVTPPDALNWHGKANQRILRVAQDLREAAAQRHLALWDWQAVMGPGKVRGWMDARLVRRDGVHMTLQGYALQSQLFYQALMDAYEPR